MENSLGVISAAASAIFAGATCLIYLQMIRIMKASNKILLNSLAVAREMTTETRRIRFSEHAPAIFALPDSTSQNEDGTWNVTWLVRNEGRGPALSVRVSSHGGGTSQDLGDIIQGERLTLAQKHSSDPSSEHCGADFEYHDLFGNTHLTKVSGARTTLSFEDRLTAH